MLGSPQAEGLDVGQSGRLVERGHHETRGACEQLGKPTAVGTVAQAQHPMSNNSVIAQRWVRPDDIELGVRHISAKAGERCEYSRAVLALPVAADKQEARRAPVALDRRLFGRNEVAADADDLHLGRRNAVVGDERRRRPVCRCAASSRVLVNVSLTRNTCSHGSRRQRTPFVVLCMDMLERSSYPQRLRVAHSS